MNARQKHKRLAAVVAIPMLFAVIAASSLVAQPSEVRTDVDLQTLFADRANIASDMPGLGYTRICWISR